MSKYLISLILLAFLAVPSWSQEEPSSEDPDALPAADETAVATEEDVDDDDLDLQTYEEDDDDFVPSEEIPADEPIPFPSNI
jgi:hypothetical protein